MRDQLSHDDSEDEDMEAYATSPTLISSHSDFPPVSTTIKKSYSMDDERSALPATASWAKTSVPGTPNHLPDRALTPDTFGPPLSVAVAQQQQQQPKQLSPTILKRKLEKKKRKELLQKQRREEEVEVTPKQVVGKEVIQPTEEEKDYKYDSLVNFVLGDAFEEVCAPTRSKCVEETPVGVSGLYEEEEEDKNNNNNNIPPCNMMSRLNLNQQGSTLEYLTQVIPTPTYTGTFNPFSHQLLRSVTDNNTNNNLFDSPVRKHSRFGFAQF